MYNPSDFTWGLELELGDVPRESLPKSIGVWDEFETDIVNQRYPYAGIAVDPRGIDPPVGGEINTRATQTIDEQLEIVAEIKKLYNPTVSCVSNTHVHVCVPGLLQDSSSLKKLAMYVFQNQTDLLSACYSFDEEPAMKDTQTALTYLREDSGSPMPFWLVQRIIKGEDFVKDLALQHHRQENRLRRYAINLASLAYLGTIEFRCFRATINLEELQSCMQICKLFLDAALNNGPSTREILAQNNFVFPPLDYNHELYLAWEKTKRPYCPSGYKPHKLQTL